jgi:hypothetical protein
MLFFPFRNATSSTIHSYQKPLYDILDLIEKSDLNIFNVQFKNEALLLVATQVLCKMPQQDCRHNAIKLYNYFFKNYKLI